MQVAPLPDRQGELNEVQEKVAWAIKTVAKVLNIKVIVTQLKYIDDYFFSFFKYASNARTNIPTYINSIRVIVISNDMPTHPQQAKIIKKSSWDSLLFQNQATLLSLPHQHHHSFLLDISHRLNSWCQYYNIFSNGR